MLGAPRPGTNLAGASGAGILRTKEIYAHAGGARHDTNLPRSEGRAAYGGHVGTKGGAPKPYLDPRRASGLIRGGIFRGVLFASGLPRWDSRRSSRFKAIHGEKKNSWPAHVPPQLGPTGVGPGAGSSVWAIARCAWRDALEPRGQRFQVAARVDGSPTHSVPGRDEGQRKTGLRKPDYPLNAGTKAFHRILSMAHTSMMPIILLAMLS